MNVNKLQILLSQILQITKNFEKMAKFSGENFNVFRTLKIESSEVRMHSALIGELLDPNGSHGQRDLYLKLFIKNLESYDKLKNMNFKTNSSHLEVEKYIGEINDEKTEGGRIDIFLEDCNNNHIIIENKIYATDQNNQLLRYYNFDKRSIILYLTLDGTKAHDYSTGGKLIKNSYLSISYAKEIIKWLEDCKKESVSLPIIRETISQYIYLIKYLTDQTIMSDVEKEIEQLIINTPEYIESIDLCSRTLAKIVDKVDLRFKGLMREKFDNSILESNNNFIIKPSCDEDGDGYWFGYQLYDNNKRNLSSTDLSKKLNNELKKILKISGYKNNSNKNYICWFYPVPFKRGKKFKGIDKIEIVKMYENPENLHCFVDSLIEQEREIRVKFLAVIKQNNLLKI